MGMNGGIGSGTSIDNGSSQNWGDTTSQKVLSQEGINKIIYDILSSDNGLASLSQGEDATGGYHSSTKALMSQDLMTKLAGEIANITAVNQSNTEGGTKSKDTKSNVNTNFGMSDTVICTELVRQRKLDKSLYEAGHEYFKSLDIRTVLGYQFWAIGIAKIMRKEGWVGKTLSTLFLPVVRARYLQLVKKEKSILGSITIYVGEPFCFLLGQVIMLSKKFHGVIYG